MIADRAVLLKDNRYYYYAMFCERQMLLEGNDMLRQDGKQGEILKERRELIHEIFMDNDYNALLLARNDGDYLLQTKWLSSGFNPDPKLVECVYSTETINVWKYLD